MDKQFKFNFSKKKIIIAVIIAVLMLASIMLIALYKIKVNKIVYTGEISRSMVYEQVKDGDENIDSTDYVKFDAFFLRDLDGDGYAEKLRGSCRQIGKEDTIYMELSTTEGSLENGVITINSDNFYLQTAIPKDNEIKENAIGNNIKKIELNTIKSGTQKFLSAIVRSGDYNRLSTKAAAIGNDTTKYSKVNSITLTGIYVAEDGTRTDISKTVEFEVDWHETTKAEIPSNLSGNNNLNQEQDIRNAINEEAQTFEVEYTVGIQEVNYLLNIKRACIEEVVPELNGHAPIKVEVTGTNVTYTYDEETRKLTAEKVAVVDENGIITSQAYDGIYSNYRYNKFNIKVTYPLEAYYKGGAETLEYTSIVNAYYEGFNNPGSDFNNPYKSNTVKGVFILNIRTGSGDVGFDIYVGKRVYKPTDRYMVSKEKALKIYNEISEEEKNDTYLVRWIGYTGANDTTGIIMKEANGEEVASDQFVKNDGTSISLENATTNIGIYFLNPVNILGEEGWIKVYDDETDELIETFTKDNWGKYNSINFYKYKTPVKHIRIETSSTNKNSSLDVYNVKQLDDEYITSNISKEEFDNIVGIRSTISGYLSGNYINLDVHVSNYEAPYSRAEIELSKDALSTQETEKNMQIIIKAQADENINQVKWQNASFLLKLPQDIIDLELNSVTSNNRNVVLTSYEQYEEDGIKYIKINTQNNTPTVFNLTVDCNITPDPRIATQTETLELYSFNENAVEYWNKAQDIYDVNDNLNTNELIGKEARNISLVSPSSLLISQTVSNYDGMGSISIAPQVASVDKSQRTADINVEIKNNYSSTISEVKILGRVPFEGNKYTINGNEMGSTFTTTMKDTGITVPEDLKDVVTVYYSENGEATRDLTDVNNNWKVASEVTDWKNIKSYLIDLGNYVLAVEEERQFCYTIGIPEGLEYNQVSYSHNGIYFTLDTAEGKYRTQIEPNKVGLMISKQYDLSLTKYQTGKEKLVSGATYSITEEGQEESKTRLTGINGNFVLKNLYLDRTYIVREIKSPVEYELNANEIKFSTYEENGELKVSLLSEQNTVKSIEVIKPQNDQGYKVQIEVEDEAKANLKIVKVEKGTENRIQSVRFKLTGEGLSEKGRTLTTNDIGEASLKGLKINSEYTLEEVKANSYYLASPIKFTINNNDGSYSVNVVEGISSVKTAEITEEDSIPTINLKIENEKIPTYNLQINKVIKGETTETGENVPLSGAKFRLLKGTEKIEDFITDENGLITINNLYQYESARCIDQTYTLKEILAPDGYSAVKDITFKVENIEGLLTMDVLEGRIKEQTASGDTISVTIEDSPSFKLIKVDGESEEVVVLPNTKFAIYSVDDGKEQIALDNKFNILGTKETINGRDYYVLTTNENGEITANLREGLYKAVEIKANDEKYDITNNVYYFGIGASREGVEKIVPTFATSVGGSDNEQITSVAETADGGIVAGGYFRETIRVGDYTLTSNGGTDGMVIKYNHDGEVEWATSIGGSNSSNDDRIQSIASTQNGEILVGGYFQGTIQVGDYILNSNNSSRDGLLIEYDLEGKVEWTTSIGSDSYSADTIQSVSETSDGGILVGGNIYGRTQIGDYTLTYKGVNDGLVIKYNSEREVEWATSVGGTSDDQILSVAETADRGILVGGYFTSENIQIGEYNLTNNGKDDGVVIKYNVNGEVEWVNSVGGNGSDKILSVAENSDGKIIVGGHFFSDSIQVGDYTLINKGEGHSRDGFIIKYNSEGEVEWTTLVGETAYDEITSVVATQDGGILAGGSMWGFNLQVGEYSLQSGNYNGVIIKYNVDGEIEWATSVGGINNDHIASVIETANGEIIAGGYFYNPNIQAGDYNLTNNGGQDGIVIKYGPKELADPKITSTISLNGDNTNEITSVSKTKDGGIVIGGHFSGTIQVGNNMISSVTKDYKDGIVIKYDNNGKVEWVNTIEGRSHEQIRSVVETQDGGVLVGGQFLSELHLGEYILNVKGDWDGMVIKYDKDGKVEWATSVGGTRLEGINSVAETKDGGIVIGGYSYGSIELGDYIFTNNTFGCASMIVKYNAKREIEWATLMKETEHNQITSVSGTSDGGIIAGGWFGKSIKVGEYTLTSKTNRAGMIIKYNRNGEVEWANSTDNLYEMNSVLETKDGEIIVGGKINYNGGLNKYDAKGKEKWKYNFNGTINSISETKDGGIIVGGYSDRTIEAGNYTLTNKGKNDGIVIKYDADGKVEWATSVGAETDDYINSVTEKEDGTIVVGGYVKSNNILDGRIWSIVNYKGVPEVEQIVAKNNRKEFKITTDVKEIDGIKGGTISGDGSSNYEKVKYGDNSTKAIVMTPEENYEIIGITVNDEEYPFTANEDGSYTMPAFENMLEDKHIEVTYSLQDRKITLNKIDSKTKEPLSGVKFKLDQIEERTAPENVIGELTDNGEYHFVKNEDGKYIPTNSKTYQEANGGTEGIQDVTANSYIPIDLSSYTGKYNLTIEAKVSSQSGNDIGYAAVTTTETAPAYNSGTGRFVYIGGTVAEKDYTTVLQGGQMYYLHLGYRKNADTDTGEDIFIVNNIRVTLNDSEIYHVEIETNSEGKAVTQIPFGKYTLAEVNTPEGYQPLKESVIIEFREDGNKVTENPNHANITVEETTGEFVVENIEKSKVIVHHYLKDNEGNYTENKVAEDDILEGLLDENYVSIPHLDLDKYELEKDENGEFVVPEKATGTFTDGEIEVTYYYVEKQIPLTVHHYIEGTTTKVPLIVGTEAEDEYDSGYENDEYTTNAISNDRLSNEYELVEIPANSEGTYTGKEVEVTYFYKKVERKVIIQKYAEDGTTVLPGATFEIEGKEYVTNQNGKIEVTLEAGEYDITEIKAPEGYKLSENPTTKIAIDRDTTEVNVEVINERIQGTVTVHHYIKGTTDKVPLSTGETAEDEIKTGNVGSIYVTSPKTDIQDGYAYVDDSNNTSGTFIDGNIEVIYYYGPRTDLSYTVNYLEKDTNNVLHDPDTFENQTFGAKITSSEKVISIDGYVYDSLDPETLTISADNSKNIINIYYVKNEIDLKVTKLWDDSINENNKRPEQIKVIVKNGETQVKEAILTSDNAKENISSIWEYTFEKLVKYDSEGKLIAYTIEEQEVNTDDLKFYVGEVGNVIPEIDTDGNTIGYTVMITNTFTVPDETIDIKVNKVWEDNNNINGKRPNSIKLIVSKVENEEGISEVNQNAMMMNAKANINSKADIKNIEEKVNVDDKASNTLTKPENIVKETNTTVEEKEDSNLSQNTSDKDLVNSEDLNESKENKLQSALDQNTVLPTNTLAENITLPNALMVMKETTENSIANEITKDEITEEAVGEDTIDETEAESNVEEKNDEITNKNEENTQAQDNNNSVIETSEVKEPTTENKDVTINKAETKPEENTSNADLLNDISDEDLLDSLELITPEKTTIVSTHILEVSEEDFANNIWEYTFTNLPKYDENGNEIKYVVTEKTMMFYEMTGGEVVIETDAEGNTTYTATLTNTFTVPTYTVDITVNKVWVDNAEQMKRRTESITIKLMNGDKELNQKTMTAENSWTVTFAGLAKYDASGNEINYTVSEESVEFYTPSYGQMTKDGENYEITITNTFTGSDETTQIPVTKVWDDNNKDRLSSIILVLTGNGQEYTQTLTEDNMASINTWEYTFSGLPKYDDNGTEIVYTLSEREVNKGDLDKYIQTVEGYTVTNTLIIKDTEISKTGPSTIDSLDEVINYTINYRVSIDENYTDDVTVTIVDSLPYEIDTDKPYNLKGGIYDSKNKTITWTDVMKVPVEVTKEISLVYKDIELSDTDTTITNNVKGSIELSNGVKEEKTTSFDTITSFTKEITLNKVWVGDNETSRPESIEVNLVATINDAEEVKKISLPEDISKVTVKASDNWTYTWSDLSKYDQETKEEIVYNIEEVQVPVYYNSLKQEDNVFTLTNYKYGNILVTKVDSKNKETKLGGAEFKLEKLIEENGKFIVDTNFTPITKITSDAEETKGEANFTNLEYGKYRLTETKSPEGYNLLRDPIDIEIYKDNTDVSLEISNKAKTILPATGGTGVITLTAIGMLAIIVAMKLNNTAKIHNISRTKNKRRTSRIERQISKH